MFKAMEKDDNRKACMVGGTVTLEQVMANAFQAPLNRATLMAFAKTERNEENLLFLVAVDNIKKTRPTGKAFFSECERIINTFVLGDSEYPINISAKTRNHTLDGWGKLRREESKVNPLQGEDQSTAELLSAANIEETKSLLLRSASSLAHQQHSYTVFDRAEEEMRHLVRLDLFRRFIMTVAIEKCWDEARNFALWCCHREETPTLASFFTYPNPTDGSQTRQHRVISTIFMLAGIIENVFTNGFVLLAIWTAMNILRVLAGPRLDPISFLVLFVTDPFVSKHKLLPVRFVKNKARRFADTVVSILSTTMLILAIHGQQIGIWVIGGVLTVIFTLHIGTNDVCLACEAWDLMVRRGMINGIPIEVVAERDAGLANQAMRGSNSTYRGADKRGGGGL
mmetsp:Transcript_30104/g.41962  ORF Transcript_30104/g.41962 Transcript_30104/m.41962 type:complete len:397 (+) Transcript_30104:1-1191(+)